ncbi:hypothetical protein AC1031_011300 [Aphanomyces cochlioides]|nr:hypothetical protein AC1031_011300 [Aphanomyces cochlioides]
MAKKAAGTSSSPCEGFLAQASLIEDQSDEQPRSVILVAAQRNGMYSCQVAGCSKQGLDLTLRQLRDHTRNTHRDIKRRKKALAKYAAKKKRETNAKKVINTRDIYEPKDVVKGLGVYGHDDCILRVQESTIPDSGNGVFTTEDLKTGDIITEYSGEVVKFQKWPSDRSVEYAVQMTKKNHWIDGVKEATIGQGLGSILKRPNRPKRPNCQFVQYCGHIYVEAKKNIKAGEELFVAYGHGYRIGKKS